tara:strand:+ start:17622 stop:18929 length:1308 start_codon:yes stop_codon:yes gene_type:complete
MQHPLLASFTALTAAVMFAGCNNDTGSTELPGQEEEHEHEHTDQPGRLVIGESNGSNSRVHVYDLESAAMAGDFALTYPPSAVYSSPGHRYAVIVQRDNDQAQLLDSGLAVHDDHVHEDPPQLLSTTLNGVKPTHYQSHEGQAALFFDGDADNARMASFQLFSDASLESGPLLASQTLATAHHGIAEPWEGYVLASHSDSNGGAASGITPYQLHGDHFHASAPLATACPGLHGGAANQTHAVFGCQDGVLSVAFTENGFEDSKLPLSERITQLVGHHELAQFAGFAGASLYAVNAAAGTTTLIDWAGGAVDGDGNPVAPAAFDLDAHGEHLAVLDNAGTLHVLEAADWSRKGQVTVLDTVGSGASAPRLAFSGVDDHLFITDPARQSVIVVDLESVTVEDTIELDFAPAGLAWTGFSEDGHDHEEEEDHDHDHEN